MYERYERIVKSLRFCMRLEEPAFECIEMDGGCCDSIGRCIPHLMDEAANAIEKLQERVAASEATIKRQSDIIQAKDRDLQRAIDAKSQWIPVTERLSDEYVSVICYCSRNDQYGCGEWRKEDNGTIYWAGLYGMIPTHWMPLPKPPKEES